MTGIICAVIYFACTDCFLSYVISDYRKQLRFQKENSDLTIAAMQATIIDLRNRAKDAKDANPDAPIVITDCTFHDQKTFNALIAKSNKVED